jgi:predicted metalloprotease
MADWSKIGSTGDVEDRRGMSPLLLGGGGIGIAGTVIVLLFNLLTGAPIDVNSTLNQLQQSQASQQTGNTQQFEGLDSYEKFASTVLGSTNDTWRELFAQSNKTYTNPKLVLFRTYTQSACGGASSDVGPHYCPPDKTIYLDETFFDELTKRYGAKGGDVAQAYVIAHEVGHHVQDELGTLTANESNADSVRTELQADCFAGVWAHAVAQEGVFQPGEINEAVDAAAAVGDDRIQKAVQGRVTPETWTHGSSADRVKWFNTGYDSGKPVDCKPT